MFCVSPPSYIHIHQAAHYDQPSPLSTAQTPRGQMVNDMMTHASGIEILPPERLPGLDRVAAESYRGLMKTKKEKEGKEQSNSFLQCLRRVPRRHRKKG